MANDPDDKNNKNDKAEELTQPVVGDAESTPEEQQTSVNETTITSESESKKNSSVRAQTHAANRKPRTLPQMRLQQRWQKILSVGVGALALLLLVASGVASQYFKNKTMPNVIVAGINSAAKSAPEIKQQLETQKSEFTLSFTSGEKTLEPKLEQIGVQFDVNKTVENAMMAKRRNGILTKLAFWKKVNVPAAVSVDEVLLTQYVEANLPELSKAPQDSQLQFDAKVGKFVVTPQADGEGANTKALKEQLQALAFNPKPSALGVTVTKKAPTITVKKLEPLVAPANDLVGQQVVLSGLGYTFKARPADIASWLTPTPQKNGSIELVVDAAKVQSYVEAISKRISNAPVDRKVVHDVNTGAEIVLQEGRSGTELADKQSLANAITTALKNGQSSAQTMNITTAAFQTVNMEAYEKWIEVDLSEQRTTAYERARPIKNFIIASGTRGHETVTGEFAIWLKVRKQTMQGGSRADGSYYSIPNVEWVSYFYKDYALHGAWWREKFGYPASHGCVNMTNADAQWLYEWAPMGTKVIVHQ